MGSRQGMEFPRQGERQQVITAGEQTLPLGGDPTLGLVVVTLRATAIAAGMIGVHLPVTVVALMNVASKERRSTVGDIDQRLLLNRRQPMSAFFPIRFTMEADNIGH